MASEQGDRLLLRIPEAAHRLNLGRSTIYELINASALPVVRVGRAVRIPVAALDAWVAQQTAEAECDGTPLA